MYAIAAAHVCVDHVARCTVLRGCMPARPPTKFSIAVPILSVRWVVLSGMDIHLVYELPRTTVLQNCTLQPNTLYNKSIPNRADIASAATFRNHTYKRCLRYSESSWRKVWPAPYFWYSPTYTSWWHKGSPCNDMISYTPGVLIGSVTTITEKLKW